MPKLEGKVHARMMRLYRHAVSENWASVDGTSLSDQQVIDKHGLVSPHNLVSMARVALFGRVSLKAPPYIL